MQNSDLDLKAILGKVGTSTSMLEIEATLLRVFVKCNLTLKVLSLLVRSTTHIL